MTADPFMPRYSVSVFHPVDDSRGLVATVVRVYRVEVAQPLQWVREHADQIAQHVSDGRPYVALNVSEIPQ